MEYRFEPNPRRLHPRIFLNGSLSGDSVPVCLPHFHVKDNSLYFLTSQRMHADLNDIEKAIWNAIDGTSCVDVLRELFGPSVDHTVERFIDLLVCELLPIKVITGTTGFCVSTVSCQVSVDSVVTSPSDAITFQK